MPSTAEYKTANPWMSLLSVALDMTLIESRTHHSKPEHPDQIFIGTNIFNFTLPNTLRTCSAI
jgi:hypothetical protein